MSHFSRNLAAFLAILLVAVGLSACGELPRPYKTRSVEEKRNNALIAIAAGRGVLVVPAEGASDKLSTDLADHVTQALHRRDVLASTGSEVKKAFKLGGLLDYESGTVTYAWVLRDQYEQTWGSGASQVEADYLDWVKGTDRMLKALANQASLEIVRILKPAATEAATKAADMEQVTVSVGGVTGAPGDGNHALARSLKGHLKGSDLPYIENQAAATVLITGEVLVEPYSDEAEKITLTWIFVKQDGEELARINQANLIPRGALDGRWGDAAFEATYALVDAVKQTMGMLHENSSLDP